MYRIDPSQSTEIVLAPKPPERPSSRPDGPVYVDFLESATRRDTASLGDTASGAEIRRIGSNVPRYECPLCDAAVPSSCHVISTSPANPATRTIIQHCPYCDALHKADFRCFAGESWVQICDAVRLTDLAELDDDARDALLDRVEEVSCQAAA